MENKDQEPSKPDFSLSINLPAIQSKLAVQLQILLDAYIASSVGLKKVDEESYQGFGAFFQFLPSQNTRLDHSAAQNQAQNWLLKSVLRDSIELTNGFLESCRIICALFKEFSNGGILGEKFNQITHGEADKYHRLGLPQKIDFLRKEFGINSIFEKHTLSINKLRTCLVHRFGVVGKEDLNSDSELVVTWKTAQIIAVSPDKIAERIIDEANNIVEAGWSVSLRLSDSERNFQLREAVSLSYGEIVSTMFTLNAFASSMVQEIETFGRSRGLQIPTNKSQ